MKYLKPALTYEQQAELLISRGLLCDKSVLIDRLRSVNYYRLSGYLCPFRNPDDTYIKGTTLDTVWERYVFDKKIAPTCS